ncbi:MAG: hypothetical protein Q9191_000297 [Dirinaria sp. TL-2023a]
MAQVDIEPVDSFPPPQSQLTNQLVKDQVGPAPSLFLPTPTLPRPWTSHETRTKLSPSPAFIESSSISKDDSYAIPSPTTPRRSTFASRGLSLQMPPRDISSTSTANLTKRIPQSPKLESPTSYTNAPSALPRRSRGMDFSRACTNLHHSTLAEQSSPDSSPTVGGRGMMILPRKGPLNSLSASSVPDSPGHAPNSLWSTAGNPEKSLSSSLGSTNMMEYHSETSSSDDDEMAGAEEEDANHTTPHASRISNMSMNPFGLLVPSTSSEVVGNFAIPAARLMSYQRARFHKARSRKSSSSASAHSSMPSPGPSSPPVLRSIESGPNAGYFAKDPSKKEMKSRRESLSLGTTDLQISDGEESDECGAHKISPHEGAIASTPLTPTMDERRNVIRRAVTRRGNLLPKSKNFSRIKALLQEEGAPIDTEVKREAEVIRQVRESDGDDLSLQPPSQPTTTASSPNILACTGPPESLEDIPEDVTMGSESASRRSSSTFSYTAMRNSGSLGFWNNFDDRSMKTPPPLLVPRGSSSGISDDINMDTPLSSVHSSTTHQMPNQRARNSDSRAVAPQAPTLVDPPRKSNKRIRDDELDPHYFKRRAVSPGVSLQNSPVLPQSPQGGWWGLPPKTARDSPNVQVLGERVCSGGSSASVGGTGGTPKRVGLQGMNDTHDGFMNMSIE